MKYEKRIILRNGEECLIRHGTYSDGADVLENFNQTHDETDYLLTYPEENSFNEEQEAVFLQEKETSRDEIELVAVLNGRIVGTAGIEAIGKKYKIRHRAEVGISILKEFWGLGIGTAFLDACLICARKAGYTQLELTVVAENTRATDLYKRMGFSEYGRNPRGFNSKISGYQELIYMRQELD